MRDRDDEVRQLADEDVLVERLATLAMSRLAFAPAAGTLPVAAILAAIFSEGIDSTRLVVWLVACAIASGCSLLALVWCREMARIGEAERGLPALSAAAGLLGAVWGAPAFVVTLVPLDASVLLLVFTLGASMLSIIVFAPVRRVFLWFQCALAATATAGLLREPSQESVALTGAGLAWLAASVILVDVLNDEHSESTRLRLRTESLVDHLAVERQHLADLNTRLLHQATHDQLTGLLNRRGTLDSVEECLASRSASEQVAVVYLDLDRFKQVNDAHGHGAGDAVLVATAQRIGQHVSPPARAGRMGGDEFVMVIPGVRSPDEVTGLAKRLIRSCAQPLHTHGREFRIGVSAGVAFAPGDADDPDGLLRAANAALHQAKDDGRARLTVFDDSLRRALEQRRSGDAELRRALDSNEIVPFLQPEVDAATGRVTGAEILARWLRRDGTILNAVAFLPAARELGLMERVQRDVLTQASPVIRRLNTLGLPDDFRFRINLTTTFQDQFSDDAILRVVLQAMPPSLLTVDVTESLVTSHPADADATLQALRSEGVKVGLDDFGRGGSSIMLLRHLPLDEVRIDQSVLGGVGGAPEDRAVLRAIVTLVHDLGLDITADGVETPTQSDMLLALGCRRQQGHHFAPALPPSDFEQFMIEREILLSPAGERWSTDELA